MARTILTGNRLVGTALAILSLLALAACDENSNNSPDRPTLRVDLASLKQQLGAGGAGGYATQAVGVPDSGATTPVYSLIVGAIVITFTDQPLSSRTTLTPALMDSLKTDAINSISYLRIVDLAAAEGSIEFDLPPKGAGAWQVVAIGARKPLKSFGDLDEDGIGIYYGFDETRRRSVGSTETASVNLQRACLLKNPPRGCAQYNLERKSIVSPGVEIVDVIADGNSIIGDKAPIVVRDVAATACVAGVAGVACDPVSAATLLNGLAAGVPTAKSLTLRTTHQLHPAQSGACRAATTKDGLIANCGVGMGEEFVTGY